MSYADRVLEIESQVTDVALVKQRRAQVVAAALELFSEQGYYRTTVQEVAKRAGVSVGLIYQYVRDKEDLVLLSILDVLDSYATEVPAALAGVECALERCGVAFRAYSGVVAARRSATVLAYRSTMSLSPERREFVKDAEGDTNQMISGCIQDCIDHGMFRAVDPELATYQLVMHAHAWALKYWHFGRMYEHEDYVAGGLDLFMHALLTEEGWAHMDRFHADDSPFSCAAPRI